MTKSDAKMSVEINGKRHNLGNVEEATDKMDRLSRAFSGNKIVTPDLPKEEELPDEKLDMSHVSHPCPSGCGRQMVKEKTVYACSCGTKSNVPATAEAQTAIHFGAPMVKLEDVIRFIFLSNGINPKDTLECIHVVEEKPGWYMRCQTFLPEVVEWINKQAEKAKNQV